MAWGLGNFLTDLVGQSNIDAAKKAYENSRFKETVVDNVDAGLGKLGEYYDAAEEEYLRRKADAEARAAEHAYKMNKIPETREELEYQNQALKDTSEMFIPAGYVASKAASKFGDKAADAYAALLKSKSTPPPAGMVNFGGRDIKAVQRMDDISDAQIAAKAAPIDKYGNNLSQQMTKAQWDIDQYNRNLAAMKAMDAAKESAAIRAINQSFRKTPYDWATANVGRREAADMGSQIARFREGLAQRMGLSKPKQFTQFD